MRLISSIGSNPAFQTAYVCTALGSQRGFQHDAPWMARHAGRVLDYLDPAGPTRPPAPQPNATQLRCPVCFSLALARVHASVRPTTTYAILFNWLDDDMQQRSEASFRTKKA
eukprot:TRINITY_DN30143_c0_g3_i3.p3 TRINITY_DN30143_c0_g3~~TRINITY_DN30143_c0_g3_i3.p3  ORF type:complete len:112 (-),score=6.20 TRINITY_DN30143_c0_g3_i3:71-406(-)